MSIYKYKMIERKDFLLNKIPAVQTNNFAWKYLQKSLSLFSHSVINIIFIWFKILSQRCSTFSETQTFFKS